MAEKPWKSKAWLHNRYVVKKMTITQMADECTKMGIPVTSMTIYNNLKAFNLIKDSRNLGKRSFGKPKGRL